MKTLGEIYHKCNPEKNYKTGKMKKTAINIVETLQNNGYVAVFAGGCVRDKLLNRKIKDYDIATNATPDKVINLFDKTISIGKSFGVINVVKSDLSFKVTTFRSDGVYVNGRYPSGVKFSNMGEDAKRRDLTINAIFYNPVTNEFYDYVNGINDLNSKILRFVGKPNKRIKEDNLRLLRFIRFMCSTGFKSDNDSWDAIINNTHLIKNVSNKRIRDELSKILIYGSVGIKLLQKSGLLKEVLHEVDSLVNCEQNPEHHPKGNVFTHTCNLLDNLIELVLFDESNERKQILLWASLLHDISKPKTFNMVNEKISAKEHETIGFEMSRNVLKRLKFPTKFICQVSRLVRDHMCIKEAKNMRVSKIKRLMSQNNYNNLFDLSFQDSIVSGKNIAWAVYLIDKENEFIKNKTPIKPPCLINGDDLIKLSFKPGPVFKILLEEIQDLQLEGVIENKNQALKYLKNKKGNIKNNF